MSVVYITGDLVLWIQYVLITGWSNNVTSSKHNVEESLTFLVTGDTMDQPNVT